MLIRILIIVVSMFIVTTQTYALTLEEAYKSAENDSYVLAGKKVLF